MQEARLESEQTGADLGAAQEQLSEVERTLKTQGEEIQALQREQDKTKVCSPILNHEEHC